MWQTIQYIGSPFALIAFVVAVISTIYRARIRSDLEKLRSLPEAERTSFLTQTLETYHIADDNLTRQQKVELTTLVLTQRAHRLKIVAQTAIALTAIIALAIVIVLVVRPSPAMNRGEDATWKRNYQFFASRHWPDKPNFGPTNAPEKWIKIVDRPSLEAGLKALTLDDEPALQGKRDSLLSLVKSAPIMNERNPTMIQIDANLDESYREFKRLLRAAAVKRGIDVERLEQEKYVEPESR